MKIDSTAAAYPVTPSINAFTKISWSPNLDGTWAQWAERKVFYYHKSSVPYGLKLRKNSTEWNKLDSTNSKLLPLGLI